MTDYGRKAADNEITALERQIHRIFTECANGLQNDITEYFARFAQREKEMLAAINAGTYPIPAGMDAAKYLQQWRLNQYLRGIHYIQLQNKCADAIANAHELAISYTNDRIPAIYAANRMFSAFEMDLISGGKYSANVDFALWDAATVRRLLKEPDTNLMPNYPKPKALQRNINMDWSKRQITAQITQSIIMGQSSARIRRELQKRIVSMSDASARRTVRTAVTAAENAGRLDTMEQATRLGIEYKKRWLCTKDKHTRESHRKLDGKIVGWNELFTSPLGGKMSAPGDNRHGAKPADLYNCRCRIVTVDRTERDADDHQMRVRNPATGKTEVIKASDYSKWQKMLAGKGVDV